MTGAGAVLRAEARLFAREPSAIFWIIAFPPLLLGILGLIPSFQVADPGLGGRRVIDLYMPVAALLGAIMAGIQAMPPVLTGYREQGILRRMSTTPVRPSALLNAQMVLHGAAALVACALVVAVGGILYGVRPTGHLPGSLLVLLLTILCALALGAAISAVTPNTKVSTAVGTIIFFPAMFSVGVYVPIQVLPETMRRVIEFTPFGAATQALDEAAGGSWPGLAHIVVMLTWTVVLSAAAARWFRWE
ncbi:ABC transporter permease [Spongiactinospora sp. TRM90649]|uniref:ABC transporter permease n=1 Tax=Spongiactinospora sp. TRM90649 TaxID=3031114 RepID=UPI0023F70775|nr:ABC transporter permease [Spongiactinospora sp. TRM90649]MDF5757019.1 ABC transporter permease [Spongiactinospora sp. TRM90649]